MTYSFQFRDVFAAWEFLLDGLVLTLELSLFTMAVGLVIGVAGAAARVYGPLWIRRPVAVYVEAIRNTPLIVQLFLIFFGLPSAGVKFDANTAAFIALSINLTGAVFVNQSAAFSDFHGTGANPAANAALTDAAYVASRFRVVQHRRHV